MEREEFPTFLNEQPTVVFGRTTRELLIILIGLTLCYITWAMVGAIIPGSDISVNIVKGACALIPLSGSLVVALGNFGSRRLEEWAAIGIFYLLTPKVYTYMPLEEDKTDNDLMEIYRYVNAGGTADENER